MGQKESEDAQMVSRFVWETTQKPLVVPLTRRANRRVQVLGKDPLFGTGWICCVWGTYRVMNSDQLAS